MKFLVDECLSPELAHLAHARGHGESSHVLWIGKAGAKDWELMPLIVDRDRTFVTRNAYDFGGRSDKPGAKGQYGKTEIHAGLVASTALSGWISTCSWNCSKPSSTNSPTTKTS